MSALDVWIYAKPASWDALAPAPEAAKQIWHYPYANAVTGYWKTWNVDYDVYNVIGSQQAVQALLDELEALNVDRSFAWTQGDGFDSLDQWPTVRADMLAVMKDHEGPVAPTYANPNWGHVFFGQEQRIFAGDFNGDFNEDFL